LNLKEGTRRLALLLGILGAIAGGFASYIFLQTILEQRTRHNSFERLAALDVVQQERKISQIDISAGLEPKKVLGPGGPVTVLGPDGNTYQFPKGTDKPAAIQYFKDNGIGTDPSAENANPVQDSPKPWEEAAKEFRREHSEVNKDGIKTINWDRDQVWKDGSGIYSIETTDGQTLYPTPAPSAWLYLLVVLCPVLGFLVPWCVVRAIGWVIVGFAQPSKQPAHISGGTPD
jgi:hypothetical protein